MNIFETIDNQLFPMEWDKIIELKVQTWLEKNDVEGALYLDYKIKVTDENDDILFDTVIFKSIHIDKNDIPGSRSHGYFQLCLALAEYIACRAVFDCARATGRMLPVIRGAFSEIEMIGINLPAGCHGNDLIKSEPASAISLRQYILAVRDNPRLLLATGIKSLWQYLENSYLLIEDVLSKDMIVDITAKSNPDVIILSIMLPGEGNLFEIIEGCQRICNCRFIILLGYDKGDRITLNDIYLIQALFDLGIRDFVFDPINPKELKHIINSNIPEYTSVEQLFEVLNLKPKF